MRPQAVHVLIIFGFGFTGDSKGRDPYIVTWLSLQRRYTPGIQLCAGPGSCRTIGAKRRGCMLNNANDRTEAGYLRCRQHPTLSAELVHEVC